MKNSIHVIVTTSYRGIFYGQMDPKEKKETTIELLNANNVIYWSSDVKGFLGLSDLGPNENCKIGAKAGGTIVLHGITSITECSAKSIEAWKVHQ